jgi:hypothetical protein
MGARQSQYEPPASRIKVTYVDHERQEATIEVGTSELHEQLRMIAQQVSRNASDRNIAIKVDLDKNFTPSADFQTVIGSRGFENILSGVYVTSLVVEGEFDHYHMMQDKQKWWARMKVLLAHVGLVFRESATVTILPLNINHATHMDSSLQDLVFEGSK